MEALRAIVLWLHLTAAVLAVGGVYFLRMILMPTVARDGCEHAPALSGKVRARFRKLVWHSIGLLVVTGGLMLWFLLRGPEPTEWAQRSPLNRHLLEAKIGLAVALFAIALALTMPAAPSPRAPKLLLANLGLGLAILLLAALRHVFR
jgi:hypothetical protein